jgi:hypothetical protein
MKKRRKSLVGWAYKSWQDGFYKQLSGASYEIPKIVSNQKYWIKSNRRKVRITIQEL